MSRGDRDIERANLLLEKAGIKQTVSPITLVSAAKELGKSLEDTLAYIARLFASAEGGVPQ